MTTVKLTGSKQKRVTDVLIFGKRKMQLTPQEAEMLDKKYTEYVDEYGVSFGFVNWLLGGGDDDK